MCHHFLHFEAGCLHPQFTDDDSETRGEQVPSSIAAGPSHIADALTALPAWPPGASQSTPGDCAGPSAKRTRGRG